MALPGGLQNLTGGYEFNQNMDNATLPGGLQSLTSGYRFDHSMENGILPGWLAELNLWRSFQPAHGECHPA